jgi:hypothetical protein
LRSRPIGTEFVKAPSNRYDTHRSFYRQLEQHPAVPINQSSKPHTTRSIRTITNHFIGSKRDTVISTLAPDPGV